MSVKCSGDYIIEDLFRNWASSELFDEQSFISKLNESHIWDDDKYWKLDNAIYDLAIKYGDDDCIPREIAWPIARIFSYLMMTFEAHHNKNDFFAIKDLDSDQVFDRRERMQLVFEGFFKGEMIPNDSFDYFDPSR
ncbi:Immunity protein 41 [Rheinheimera pacifica]|uniref:Immunity protein 41 n=1 Tax=Rheinheimera pacifica TaxID=173990 RepID=A0A1H6NG11_9GAMM|nr:Imm41 family immunity protein [Rheinheimera pacifica]SEI14209.1 Immunity protein 41 [Rheinheimera pacifica]